ncbi:hypothetical protein CCACVL1_29131 [Corchorus capsularis]|uniref:Uncharacterized protein n=1 Tax=Corchorus capsularis TaxID=210143 RepID=A0A1R3G3R9_COCAP|nr:hypothetical protein CCACVL1_29131 [Corchorus capsularis]
MDPFKHFASQEGCSSSESGWTGYIASPMQEDSEYSEDNYKNNYTIKDDDDDVHGEGNSDDSTVSDASSAPSHYQYKHREGQASHGSANLKVDKGDYSSKHSSRKEAKKEAKKSTENSGKTKRRLGGLARYRK